LKAARTFTVPADHPAFAGHFPGMPILPGAALLDAVLHMLEEDLAFNPLEWQITSAKFLAPVRPGDVLVVEHSANTDVIRFSLRVTQPRAAQLADRDALAGILNRSRSPHEL
jgi:3-hydroxyacyl-[acyl-carrier-protein] dehydratase